MPATVDRSEGQLDRRIHLSPVRLLAEAQELMSCTMFRKSPVYPNSWSLERVVTGSDLPPLNRSNCYVRSQSAGSGPVNGGHHGTADLCVHRGTREAIRSDNDPEFIAKVVWRWLSGMGARMLYIEPGRPRENGNIGSFNLPAGNHYLRISSQCA